MGNNYACTITLRRARKKVVRYDQYTRYEIYAGTGNFRGEILIPKGGTALGSTDTLTLTLTQTSKA